MKVQVRSIHLMSELVRVPVKSEEMAPIPG
jgi:hypothetical protein